MATRRAPYALIPNSGRLWGGVDRPEAALKPPLAAWPDLLGMPTPTVTVGVVDTGIALDSDGKPHPWFADTGMSYCHLSYCREEDEDILPDPMPPVRLGLADGHGTFVSGLILHEAPGVRVRMWGVIDKYGTRVTDTNRPGPDDDRAVAAAIRMLAINPSVEVINLSFGGGVFVEEDQPPLLKAALRDIDYDRVAVVASAGNDASGRKAWPAAFKHVISVGALDDTTVVGLTNPPIAAFSNWGGWIRAYASGVKVLGPFVQYDDPGDVIHVFPLEGDVPVNYHGWAKWSGTSFAAATVSGRIAQRADEHGISGARAAKEILEEAPRIHGAAWIK